MKEYLRKTLIEFLIVMNFFFSLPNKTYSIDDKVNEKNTTVQVDSTKTEQKEEEKEPPKRSIKIDESFILTDKTRANTFRIESEKEWTNFKDKLLISYDVFGQKDEGRMKLKKNRIELNYKLFISKISKKLPFIEYIYSTDQPTKLNWKVLSGGIGQKLPFDLMFDIGYGYKWGKIEEKEIYQYDVVTINLSNEKRFSIFTLKQNLKNIIPRNIEPDKQPIYDYKSSLSTKIAKNLDATLNFDWRYQKIPKLKNEDWFNYKLKFGIIYIPRK